MRLWQKYNNKKGGEGNGKMDYCRSTGRSAYQIKNKDLPGEQNSKKISFAINFKRFRHKKRVNTSTTTEACLL